MLKRLVATFFAAALVCSAACADQPPTQRMGTPQHGQKFYGPGSRGFLPSCSSVFTATNFALASNNFLSTPWVKEGSTSPAVAPPTVTSGAADPNGGTSAFLSPSPPFPGRTLTAF
jgi:hypothetical protein